jgi:hypothetical protein
VERGAEGAARDLPPLRRLGLTDIGKGLADQYELKTMRQWLKRL